MKISMLFLGLGLFFLHSFPIFSAPSECSKVVLKLYPEKAQRDLSQDPVRLITAEEGLIKSGPIFKRWDEELETSVYSTIAEPRKDGSVPWVFKNAKAVLIFFHGSGTAKASGKNFAENQNILRPMGISGVSLDLPFHGENKGSEKLRNMDNFMNWINQFVKKVRSEADQAGKNIPVYMMGHSSGPSVIQEYVERYPKDITDFLLMSPAGDFHPALKYTYEKITTPGEKFLEGEPVIENAAGGEWAGGLEGQFTWHKRNPFDRIPGRMLIGEKDEWWPGNKDLAAKVGVEQPYEFDQPLKYFQKKYPKMQITTIPGVGHMLFEAQTPKGENLVRKSILDMIGIPEKDRNPPGVGVSPGEKIALLYTTSPLFREWIGNRYNHSFSDSKRTEGVLKDWEKSKLDAWKKVLERISTEFPEFARARGFSVASATARTKLIDPSLDGAGAKLQQDLVSYLTGDAKQKVEILSRKDPETPKAVKVQPALLEKGWAPTKNGATGPLIRNLFEQKIKEKGATNIEANTVGHRIVKLSYEVEGMKYENLLLDYTEPELQKKINELYLKAFENNSFYPPGDIIEVLDEGVRWRFSAKDKSTVTNLQFSL